MHADDAHKLAEQHFATLVAALEAGRSDALVRYLETASRFHTYSFRNQCLIAAQCPTATRVAGYQAWRQLGCWVRRGETGIAILAPITRRRAEVDADGDAIGSPRHLVAVEFAARVRNSRAGSALIAECVIDRRGDDRLA
jgi:hypothetical protein